MRFENRRKVRIYRIFLKLCTAAFALCFSVMGYSYYYKQIPNTIKIQAGKEETLNFGIPASATLYKDAVEVSQMDASNIPKDAIYFDLAQDVTFLANEQVDYNLDVKLFGMIPLKQVKVEVIQEKMLIPMGMPIGIYVKTDGILVVGTGNFTGNDGTLYEPSKHILKSGDYIQKINGNRVNTKREVIDYIENCEGKELIISVLREDEVIDLKLQPQKNDMEVYKLGIWLRDSAQGIGTMTFVDESGNFGALGHGINDIDTSTLMNLESGKLFQTEIVCIKRGESGNPGELTGAIDYDSEKQIGNITVNSEKGIFGECNETLLSTVNQNAIPIGLKQDVSLGEAQILCNLDGNPTYYDIEIVDLQYDAANVNRGIVLKITDPDLLALTGGIVQGMSGSPIVQNGKLIGAVTHVLIQDATKGYGIFIENMLLLR